MPVLLTTFPDAYLLIVGKGDHDADLLRLTDKLLIKGSVTLLNWLPHNDLPALLSVAKCFCLPSYWEGLSKAALEAFSAEVPFIGSANLSNIELTKNGAFGWLVNEETPEAWSNAIGKVLSAGSDVQMKTKNASNIVDQMYRWNHVAQRIDAAYQKVLKE
jgi:glycosyltransferase involved in cell wall biosynthesis